MAVKKQDLIDRAELIKAVERKQFAIADNTHPYEAIRIQGKYFREVVDNAPSVDATEVVHGYWKPTGDPVLDNIYGVAVCSICGYEYAGSDTNYCPDCGAKMDGGTSS